MLFGWLAWAQLEKTTDLYAAKRPYPPYLYISNFTQFYAMGKLAASPQKTQIYDAVTQDKFMNDVLEPLHLHTTRVNFGQNVPWFFCLMVPFSLLPLRVAFYLYCILGVAFSAVGLTLVGKDLCKATSGQIAILVLGALSSIPAWICLQRGNTSYFLLGWACIYVWALFRKKNTVAGVALALLAQKPQYAIPLAVPALSFKRWSLLAVAAGSEAVLYILAGLHLGANNILNYPTMLVSADTNSKFDGMYPLQMVSVRAIFASLFSQHLSMPLACATFAVSLCVLLWMWLKVSADDAKQYHWAMAVTIVTMLVVSPHTSLYDVLLLSLPALLTIQVAGDKPRTMTWTVLMASYPVTSWIMYLTENRQVQFQHQALTYFDVILLLVVAVTYIRLFVARAKPSGVATVPVEP